MIWSSTALMTILDLLIVGAIAYAAISIRPQPGSQLASKDLLGLSLIIAGLSVFGLFYAVDLLVMHAFPLFMPASLAMGIMEDLHLNHRWWISLIGILSIAAGMIFSFRNLVNVSHRNIAQQENWPKARLGLHAPWTAAMTVFGIGISKLAWFITRRAFVKSLV